jgi:hypothetical protein
MHKTFAPQIKLHRKMVKVVAVLGSSEGVCGTIYFTQEGDGNLEFLYNL